MPPLHFVYILESIAVPGRHDVGLTSDVPDRVKAHNAGDSPYTARYRPWRLLAAVEFANPDSVARFERYLKSGSGRVFAKRHFV